MASTRRAASSAAVALAAAALAACGGGSGEERLSKTGYEQTVRDSYAQVHAAFLAAGRSAPDELAAKIEAAQSALRAAAEQLEAVEPPEAVAEQNEELVEGMREYAEQLDDVRDAAGRGDGDFLAAFNEAIGQNEAVERIAEAAEEMKFMGYDLGRIAEE